MDGWRRGLLAVLASLSVGLGGCQYIPSIPNPFRSEATPAPAAAPAASPSPPAGAAAFTPFWVKNHQITEMWSGQSNQPGVVSFGMTSAQFCSFQVVRPPDGDRLYVLNPYSNNYFWVDVNAVGPVPNGPERRPGPKPADQNCFTDAIFEG